MKAMDGARRGRLTKACIAATALASGVLAWHVVCVGMVDAEERQLPRHAESGVIEGLEPREFGPVDASRGALFVHGIGGSPKDFDGLPERLADRGWHVRVMLLPGHGTRARDLKNTTAEEATEAVRREVVQLGKDHDTVMLVGFSMGGALATLIAAQESATVDGLVLGAPYFGVTYKWYYVLRPETWTRLLAGPVPWVYKGDVFRAINDRSNKRSFFTYRVMPTRSFVVLDELGRAAGNPETLRRVTCPVLVLHAPKDIAASFTACAKAFEAMASSDKRFVRLENTNHHLFWDYDREQVYSEVLAFAAGLEEQSSGAK